MYTPKYSISNEILKNIGVIEACREVIDNAPLIPAWEKKFRQEAMIRTVHYGTHLEGNELSFSEVAQVVEGKKVLAKDRDIQEVINYRNVLKFIDELEDRLRKSKGFVFTKEQLKKIHSLTCQRILASSECGNFRKTQVVIRNSQTGEVAFRPPPAIEVPYLIDDFLNWLNSSQSKEIHPIIRAGITHYALVAIHPFVEGNGRTARAFATVVLFAEGYDIKKFFAIEEYFDKNASEYYGALQTVSNQDPNLEKRDLTPWLEYFTQAMAIELNRIKEKVRKLSVDLKLRKKIGKQIALSERQTNLVEYLEEYGEITTSIARKILPMVSDDTILRDLKDLLRKGIVKKEGKTKAAKYILRR